MRARRDSRTLRRGYTTGACAAAAARAAMLALCGQAAPSRVDIKLPDGNQATFEVSRCMFDLAEATCSVIKDAGDDPDITHGAEIRATVSWDDKTGIHIHGGEGVGVVTKPGLEIAVGYPAINPVPRQMITDAVNGVCNRAVNKGVRVTITVPNGVALAKRTLNLRLGIVGGISILGTTGIVIPYSVAAYTACISQGLDVAVACGCREAVLTTGRRSEKFAQRVLALPDECFIQAGDFIGFSLKECARKGIPRVVIWSMIGKMSKLADGHMYTNVSDSQVDITFMADIAASSGIPRETVESLGKAITANHFRKLMLAEHLTKFCDELCRQAAKKCRQHVSGTLDIECIVTDPDGVILGRASER
ncbi:MAG: cobalt-precorrin-5B (C(1))-methyltransferase [Chloroflexi bacterium]|nr:cobalt-precorrin-5B (C(1))-methyltransferase [Chloroflexota bacterium]